MQVRLAKELEKLKRKILFLSARVEEQLHLAIKAVRERDAELSDKIEEMDYETDRIEVELEEECLKLLALHQPVAIDLRFIVAVLKINNDLERIGDLAVNISKRGAALSKIKNGGEIPFDMAAMSEKVKTMVSKSIDSLVNMDTKLAQEVRASDNEVDKIHRNFFTEFESIIKKNPEKVSFTMPFLGVSRFLERIADHTTNIAEDVIYLIEGDIVRHQRIDD